jgi:hypothetical protein
VIFARFEVFIPKMDAARFSEKLVYYRNTARCHNPQDQDMKIVFFLAPRTASGFTNIDLWMQQMTIKGRMLEICVFKFIAQLFTLASFMNQSLPQNWPVLYYAEWELSFGGTPPSAGSHAEVREYQGSFSSCLLLLCHLVKKMSTEH